jgi:hypothetical protein
MRWLAPRKFDGQPAFWISESFPYQSRWPRSNYRIELANRSTGECLSHRGARQPRAVNDGNPGTGRVLGCYYARNRRSTNTAQVLQASRTKISLHSCRSQHVERNAKLKSATTVRVLAAATSGPLNLTLISSSVDVRFCL